MPLDFMPPNGVGKMADVFRIDPDHAGLERLRDAVRAADVAGPDVGRETVVDVIGHADRIRFVLERNCGQHRSEDFLLRDPHGGLAPLNKVG